jgi:hypothetical protein
MTIMKKVYTLLAALLILTGANAKTYTIASGKWSDASVWGGQYIGAIIKAGDVVIITGQMTMNTSIVVEGTLQVEKGAGMVGMKDLVVAKNGNFVNNGNTVMKRIVNEGTIKNNMMLEAILDIENKSVIENNNMVTGSNFENFGGNATGNGGSYFVSNQINSSPASKFGADVKVFSANANEQQPAATSTMHLNAAITSDAVVLTVANPAKNDVSVFSIEKSTDGINYSLIEMVTNTSTNRDIAMAYTDLNITNTLTYYRVTALAVNGENIVLPVATVKVPANGYAMAR